VLKFPTPHVLQKAGPRQWEKWLRANRLMRADSPIDRMGVFARALEFKGSEAQIAARSLLAQSCARMLLLLEEQLQQYRRRIEALFADHPDKDLFGSLPGAGPKLAPRILSEMGAHRARFETPGSLQSYAGSAPITIRSGQVCKVRFRHAANSFLRSAVHLWVDLSRKRCAWAQTYYKQHRAKGKSHACAIRCLAQRWLKILWTMWVSRSPYNEALHTQNQIKHGSWILKLQP
jgi:transposase